MIIHVSVLLFISVIIMFLCFSEYLVNHVALNVHNNVHFLTEKKII